MATLQQDYLKTLQANVGQSQRQLKENLRKTQETGVSPAARSLSNVPSSYDWDARQVSGFRGAGFNPVANVPNHYQEASDTFGNAVGKYVEGGQEQAGYYTDVNPFTQQGADTLFKQQGYENLGQGIDTSYVGYIPELAKNLYQYKGDASSYNLYATDGHDPRKISFGNAPSLEQAFRDLYNQTQANKYTTFGFGGSEGKWGEVDAGFGTDQTYMQWQPPIPAQTGYRYQGFDYDNLDALKAAQQSELNYLLSDPNVTRNAYLQLKHGGDLGQNAGLIGHTRYYNPDTILEDYGSDSNGIVKQAPRFYNTDRMVGGKPEDALKNKFGNIWNGTVSDSATLKTLFSGKDLLYNGVDYADIFDDPGRTLTHNKWDDSWQSTSKNLIRKRIQGENKGGENYLQSQYNLGYKTPDGKYFSPNDFNASATFAGDDKRYNSSYNQSSLTGFGKVLGTALSIFGGPFGAVASSALNGMNTSKSNNAYTGESYRSKQNGLGMVAGFLGGQIPGLSETVGKQFGLTGNAAKMLGGALVQGGIGTASGLGSGKSLGDALKQGAGGAITGGLQQYFGDNLAGLLGDNELGKVVATTAMKTGTKGLNNLLTGNKFGRDMGTAAVSGALSGLGNLYDRYNKDATTYQQMQKPQQQTRKV